MNQESDLQSSVKAVFFPEKFSRNALLFRAVLLLLTGVLLGFRPWLTLTVFTTVVGFFLIFEAMWLFAAALPRREGRTGGILHALLTLILGFLCIASPLMMNLAWMFVLGFWQLVSGGNWFMLAATVKPRTWPLVSGILATITGLLFLIWPAVGLAAMAWVLAALLILFGVILLLAALSLPKAAPVSVQNNVND